MLVFVSDVKESEKFACAVGICYELRIDKLTVPFEVYQYVYDLKMIKDVYYIRFGLKYNPWKNLFLGCFVKGGPNSSGAFVSSFMEVATGWSFAKKY